jgi:hypothetical protein
MNTKLQQICEATINLSQPSQSQRVRGFQPPWHTVYIYTCRLCGTSHRVRASTFRGTRPEPGTGAIRCGTPMNR